MRARFISIRLCASIFAQYAAIDALQHAQDEKRLMKQSYQQRRQLFVDGLNAIGLDTLMPDGAFYCFPDIRSSALSSRDSAIALLNEQQVAVVPGDVFGVGGEGYVRCCYAASLDDLKESLNRMARLRRIAK